MRVEESLLRDVLRLIVWGPFRWFIGILPLNLAFWTFKFMGDVHYLVARKKRRQLADRMQRMLGVDGKDISGSVRRYFQLHYLDRMHIILYPRLIAKKKICNVVEFENISRLTSLMNRGQGILIVQPHFGPVQLTLLALSLQGYDPMQIGFPNDQGLSKIGKNISFKYRLHYEGQLPAPIISANGYMGKAYKHLVKDGIVLTTGDGAGGDVYLGEHKDMKFLDHKRKIPLGPAALAIRTGSVFLPTFIIPEKYNRFRVIFDEPIYPKYNELERDKVHMMEEFTQIVEKYIKKYPYCWHFWDEIQNHQ